MQVEPLSWAGEQTPAVQTLPAAQSASELQVAGQLVEPPSHTSGEQLGSPAEPAGASPQLPSLPARLQESQLSLQAELQQ